jgi:TatD DNase family protein
VLVDTHCHLGDERFDADRAAVVARARQAGVRQIVVVADSADASVQAVDLARRYGLCATAGVHPHVAATWSSDVRQRIADALDDPAVVAVGETGLDYHYDHSPRVEQRRAFEAQLALGAERGLPVVIHARDADDDMTAMLDGLGADGPSVILHSFSSGRRVFEAGLRAGAYVSFSGMVTFRNWRQADTVRTCPADRLLIETDAPYLSPVPHRGKRNEPAHVPLIAARVADLRGVAADAVATLTTANAEACFGARVAQQSDD